jgi:hypothetical protein
MAQGLVTLESKMAIRLVDHKSIVHSQHGEDGMIAAIFDAIGIKSKTCVEFGAFDLRNASNVYPLWTTGWKTLLIEGNVKRYSKLVADYAAYPGSAGLDVSFANRFVDADGPNSLDNILSELDFPVDLDLVVMDVDGMEYHIWQGCKRYQPRVAIVEYNCMIPHHIELIGAAKGNDIACSVLSLAKLGQQKGYSLVACVEWNAFFVRREYADLFTDADDLDALFDPKYIRYAMQSYNGEVFFSGPLLLDYQPFLHDTDFIDTTSVTIGRLGDTLSVTTKRTLWQYGRKMKHLLLGPPRRKAEY